MQLVKWVAIYAALALAFTPASASSSAALPVKCTSLATIECTLRSAGVHNPAAISANLLRSELRSMEDVAELDMAEVAELFEELRAAAVPLGDRARLRKAARLSGAVDRTHPFVKLEYSVPPAEPSGKARGGSLATGLQFCAEEHSEVRTDRQLQSGGGGFSIEVAAIAFTGLIGMVGYAVQARVWSLRRRRGRRWRREQRGSWNA
jgi:hypothetical protein